MLPTIRVFLTTTASFAAAFALGYVVAMGTCAPPSILCHFPGVGCFAVCRSPWIGFPELLLFGLAFGVVPGGWRIGVSAAHEKVRGRSSRMSEVTAAVAAVPAGLAVPAALLQGLGLTAVWTLAFGLAFAAVVEAHRARALRR